MKTEQHSPLLELFARAFWLLALPWALNSCQWGNESSIPEEKLAELQVPEQVDFNLHIKPILSDRCFACHGPDKNKTKGDLQLHTAEKAYAALGENRERHALVPGDIEESSVYHRIWAEDEELVMPPPESNLKLDERERVLITRWIEQGAEYKPHWSYIPPEKTELPEVQNEAWANNEIDHFILQKLEAEGIKPAPEADKATLVRRASFDLTGLPPTLEEIDRFMADGTPKAYENMVDRLLESPHYGEAMAVDWLDLARYADSHGYQDDGMRNMWPWRDWVIGAFNKNLPYDQFVTWQLAGDLLENPTHEQILATGFNRNHMQSQEGGIVSEEYRTEYVADRANTVGKAFLGLTFECARCHDHKYDPLSQKEYFQMFAFFNNINETGQIPYMGEASPTLTLTSEEAENTLAFIRGNIRRMEEKTKPERYEADFENWLKELEERDQPPAIELKGQIGHYPLDTVVEKDEKATLANLADSEKSAFLSGAEEDQPRFAEGFSGNGRHLVGDSHIDMGRNFAFFERNQPFSIGIRIKILKDSISGPIFSKSGGLFNGNRGYDFMLEEDGTLSASLNHTFPDNSIAVVTQKQLPTQKWLHLMLTYDGSSRAEGIGIYLEGKPLPLTITVDNLKQSILYYGPDKKNWGGAGTLRIGRRFEETLSDVVVDDFRVFERQLTPLEVRKLFGEKEVLANALKNASDDTRQALMDYYLANFHPPYQVFLDSLTIYRGQENDLLTKQPEVMVMRERRGQPRASFILDRGAYDAPTVEVKAQAPESVMAFPAHLPKNRLGLAKWLLMPENPLFARVSVNRYWQHYFGKGIVPTPGDFGNQGDLPTHPQLLDWLATYFRESGWDVKALQKKIVMSATYRQSSKGRPELQERDPSNLLYARANGYRMSAEMVRDNALAASGLLVREIGGPSVKPYQPPGLWKQLATRNATKYVQDHGEKLYRRSMYTVWKRTSPPPSMINFDASERNFCMVKRQKTSTPLQALVLLNDPQFVEAARVLAKRLIKEAESPTPEARIHLAFKLLTSRQADESEVRMMKKLLEAERAHFQANPQEAKTLISTGEYPLDSSLDPVEHATYTVLASTLINFDEAVFKR